MYHARSTMLLAAAFASFAIVTLAGAAERSILVATAPPPRIADEAPVSGVASMPSAMEGDFNGDGIVGVEDLAILLGQWGAESCDEPTDLTNDCTVDLNDVFELYHNWTTVDDS
ncbi:MAG: hypothetical protein U0572_10880 [Phycisphaerales bacterium]